MVSCSQADRTFCVRSVHYPILLSSSMSLVPLPNLSFSMSLDYGSVYPCVPPFATVQVALQCSPDYNRTRGFLIARSQARLKPTARLTARSRKPSREQCDQPFPSFSLRSSFFLLCPSHHDATFHKGSVASRRTCSIRLWKLSYSKRAHHVCAL